LPEATAFEKVRFSNEVGQAGIDKVVRFVKASKESVEFDEEEGEHMA
jgi:hypothetical protein